MQKFDIVCISVSYLKSDTSSSNDDMNIPGYNMFRANHPSGNRGEFAFIIKSLCLLKC